MADFSDVVPAPNGRFEGIERPYGADEVLRLRGSIPIEHTLARRGALRLWELLKEDEPVRALGAMSGNQAMQMVRAGLKAIYLSGWQAAADANTACAMYPDQSLYPANTGPELAKRINRALQRADQIEHSEGGAKRDWFAPIVADAEAGFGGPLNCFEIMKGYIEAGVAGVHFEDQLASEKKCGHLGGKVLIPTKAAVRNLDAARLAADVSGVPTILVARTDAESAKLLTSDVDERDQPFITGERTAEGFYRLQDGTGLDNCISRAKAFAPHADLLWFETSKPNLDAGAHLRRSRAPRLPGQDARLQLLAQLQLGGEPRPRHHRPLPARARRDGLQVPVRDAGRLPQPQPRACSSWRAATATVAWRLIRSFSRPSSPARPTATPPPATSAKSAPAISTPSPPPSRAANRRPPRSRNRPKLHNSSQPSRRRAYGTALLGHRRSTMRIAGSASWSRAPRRSAGPSTTRSKPGWNGSA